MTDEDFWDYCEAHSETPRCGFVPEHLSRLCLLAGLPSEAKRWSKEANGVFSCNREAIKNLVRAGRQKADDDLMKEIDSCAGAEVPREQWRSAERLVAAGKITLGPARGPGRDWRRAEPVEVCDE
jgi:hypothetical protein